MAVRTTRFSQRKEPIQARSRLTVKAILEATAQVLVMKGYERTNTDAVATRAGVSIGTLYQYFPNKESLVAALIRNHVDEVIQRVDEALTSNQDASLEIALVAMVHAGIEAHRIDPSLHKVLFEQVPRSQVLGEALDVSSRLQTMIEMFLRKKVLGVSRAKIRIVALVLETTLEALTHRAVVEAPDWLRSGALEKEAIELLRPYLLGALR